MDIGITHIGIWLIFGWILLFIGFFLIIIPIVISNIFSIVFPWPLSSLIKLGLYILVPGGVIVQLAILMAEQWIAEEEAEKKKRWNLSDSVSFGDSIKGRKQSIADLRHANKTEKNQLVDPSPPIELDKSTVAINQQNQKIDLCVQYISSQPQQLQTTALIAQLGNARLREFLEKIISLQGQKLYLRNLSIEKTISYEKIFNKYGIKYSRISHNDSGS
ncbi:MAG: hypothetical protein H7832_10660 [Magnetococcus sp. DMHC-6]